MKQPCSVAGVPPVEGCGVRGDILNSVSGAGRSPFWILTPFHVDEKSQPAILEVLRLEVKQRFVGFHVDRH
ncbi:MAG: hypothetical protein ACREPR_11080 [Brasilonema sp.]